MNAIERQMVETLGILGAEYGATAVKASMEAEGILLAEILRLKEIVMAAGVGLSVKIGGCEALTDARLARGYGVSILMAPMIESRFALEKFLDMAASLFPPEERDETKFYINIETLDGYKKIDEILTAANGELLDGIVLGRTDLRSALAADHVDSAEMLAAAKAVFTAARKRSLRGIVGGGITERTIPFLLELGNLIDGFETRKVVFGKGLGDPERIGESIRMALRFEYLWYQLRQQTYLALYREDEEKMKKMEPLLGR